MVLSYLLVSHTISFPSHIVLLQLDQKWANGIDGLKMKYRDNNSETDITISEFKETKPNNDILIRTSAINQTSSAENCTFVGQV